MPRKRSWSDTELRHAVENSSSLSEVIKKIGLKVVGGNFSNVADHIERMGITTEHFGQGGSTGYRKDLDEYTSNRQYIRSFRLKQRLYDEGLKEVKCEQCGLEEWHGHPIPTELHHIDGDRKNNHLDNLQILCPNCHALTDNYRGRKED